jgi:hypothetical protein
MKSDVKEKMMILPPSNRPPIGSMRCLRRLGCEIFIALLRRERSIVRFIELPAVRIYNASRRRKA